MRLDSVGEGEVLVDGAHRGRSFADGSGDPLGGAGPDIADREQPGVARLEGQRPPAQRVPTSVEVSVFKGSIGQHDHGR